MPLFETVIARVHFLLKTCHTFVAKETKTLVCRGRPSRHPVLVAKLSLADAGEHILSQESHLIILHNICLTWHFLIRFKNKSFALI